MLKILDSFPFFPTHGKQSGFSALLVLLVGFVILASHAEGYAEGAAEAKRAYEKIARGDSLTEADKYLMETYLPAAKPGDNEYLESPITDNGGIFFIYSGPVLRIPPTGSGGEAGDSTVVVFNVSGLTGAIADVQLTLDTVRHTFDSDLIISLESPTGSLITLVNRRGGSSNHFFRTLLTDSAIISIASGASPFTRSFLPEEPLSLFDGEVPNGEWRLKFLDVAAGDTGSVRRCKLQILAESGAEMHDFSCINILSPTQGFFLPGTNVNIAARVVNLGTTSQSTPVKYRFDAQPSVSENTPVIQPFTFIDQFFSTPLTLPMQTGIYSLYIYTDLPTDQNRSNDSCLTSITVRDCEDLFLQAPGVINGNTCGAGDDCGLRPSEDQVVRVQIPSEGEWNFSLCGSVIWDSYEYLTAGCCGTEITFDDDGCGEVFGLSQISCIFLSEGDYYVAIEGWQGVDCGDYALSVTPCGSPCLAPQELTVSRQGDDALLIWKSSPSAHRYTISTSPTVSGPFMQIASVLAPDTFYLDPEPFDFSPQFYQVTAECP